MRSNCLLKVPLFFDLATRDEFMCITFGVTFRVTFGVTIFGSFLQNGYNSVTRPPIEILRPLFTLQLLILPTRDPFHAQKSLKNAEIGRCHKLWLQMWLQMRLQMWLQMRLQMWCTWTHLWWSKFEKEQMVPSKYGQGQILTSFI